MEKKSRKIFNTVPPTTILPCFVEDTAFSLFQHFTSYIMNINVIRVNLSRSRTPFSVRHSYIKTIYKVSTIYTIVTEVTAVMKRR